MILVGGQTRMPLVQEKIEAFFKKETRKDINPDQAVAIGAAVQGAVLSGDVKDVLLLDVAPYLSVLKQGGIMTKLIEKYHHTYKNHKFSTSCSNQTEVTIHVLQGGGTWLLEINPGRFNQVVYHQLHEACLRSK